MKKLVQFFSFIFAALYAMIAANSKRQPLTGDVPFPGSMMYGDVELGGGVTVGDIEIGDVDESDFEGESVGDIASRVKKALNKKSTVNIQVAPGTTGPAYQVAAAAAQAAGQSYMGMPGTALQNLSTIPMWAVNAKIATPGTARKISGNTLKSTIEHTLSIMTWASTYLSATSAGGTATLSFLGNADGVHRHKPIPMVFITIAASQLIARAGGRIAINFTYRNAMGVYGGGDGQGQAFVSDTWVIERGSTNKAIQLVYFPYVRVKDTITPNPAVVGCNLLDLVATLQDLTITVTGLSDDETVSGVLPGLDSTDLHGFLKAFKVKI